MCFGGGFFAGFPACRLRTGFCVRCVNCICLAGGASGALFLFVGLYSWGAVVSRGMAWVYALYESPLCFALPLPLFRCFLRVSWWHVFGVVSGGGAPPFAKRRRQLIIIIACSRNALFLLPRAASPLVVHRPFFLSSLQYSRYGRSYFRPPFLCGFRPGVLGVVVLLLFVHSPPLPISLEVVPPFFFPRGALFFSLVPTPSSFRIYCEGGFWVVSSTISSIPFPFSSLSLGCFYFCSFSAI